MRNVIEEARIAQKAAEIQAELMARIRKTAGRNGGDVRAATEDVLARLPPEETVQSAAGGRAGRGGIPGGQEKIASLPAAARAPKAGGRNGSKKTGGAAQKQREEPPEIPEKDRTKPNRRENEFFMNLMILRNTLRQNAPACQDRARMAGKYVWRDIRLMTVLVDRIQNALRRTIPARRDEYYCAYARHGHYELHIDGPIQTVRHLLVTDVHLSAMAEAAMKSECILCMREGSEIGQCPLREALLEAAPPKEIEDGLWRKCEYRDAAGQLVLGKDVTV